VKRREFITLLGCAAAWPLAARAQQPGKLPTVGYMGAATPATQGQWAAAFVQRLRELGWIEGSYYRDRVSLDGGSHRARR
jgi:putative ABC transport system substrate-binding protein